MNNERKNLKERETRGQNSRLTSLKGGGRQRVKLLSIENTFNWFVSILAVRHLFSCTFMLYSIECCIILLSHQALRALLCWDVPFLRARGNVCMFTKIIHSEVVNNADWNEITQMTHSFDFSSQRNYHFYSHQCVRPVSIDGNPLFTHHAALPKQ